MILARLILTFNVLFLVLSTWKLDLDDNDLSGTFPSGLGNLRNLTQAYLNGNQFSGTLPAGIFEHLGKLSVLSVYKLLLTGTVPTEVGLLTSLKTNFFLAENDFTGTIPSELGLLSNVGIISLHATSLSGTLPSELLRLTNLEVLSVSDTSLTGSIPDGLCGRIYDLEFSCLDTNYETELVLCTGIKAVNFSCSASLLCGCNCDACT